MLQADALAGLDEVLTADVAEIGVVQDQVAQFRALLDQIDGREAFDLVVEAAKAD